MILTSPLDEKTVRSLKIGDTVHIDGPIITGRDEMHIRALKMARAGDEVPEEIYNSVLYHCGPIMIQSGERWIPVAAGPTTSARMNDMESEMIERFGIKAIIGKGGMSSQVAETMKKCGCVYLAAVGGTAVSLAEGLGESTVSYWNDLGMAEAIWKFDTKNFGPLTVAIDTEGGNLYDRVRENIKR